jgi:SAM-dependent methyltransferase
MTPGHLGGARHGVMAFARAYRLWQAPFAGRKVDPLRRHNDLATIRRVLDVGCGPGTNRSLFAQSEYLGLDINPAYIEDARRRYGAGFEVVDVARDPLPAAGAYDAILLNSFLHHVDDASARRVLERIAVLLTGDGHVHILDLVMPDRPSIARRLARWDRGDHARPLEEWRTLFSEAFDPVVFEPYPLGLAGVTLWNMVYFKGKRKA